MEMRICTRVQITHVQMNGNYALKITRCDWLIYTNKHTCAHERTKKVKLV